MAVYIPRLDLALQRFTQLPLSGDMISYLALKTSEVVPPLAYTGLDRKIILRSVHHFIEHVALSSRIGVPTLMTTLVYMDRVRWGLSPDVRGIPSSPHRIFLACLVVTAKFLNDKSPMNKYWARCSDVTGDGRFGFSAAEVNLMEFELLSLLEWNLRIRIEDLYHHLGPFLVLSHVQRPFQSISTMVRGFPMHPSPSEANAQRIRASGDKDYATYPSMEKKLLRPHEE